MPEFRRQFRRRERAQSNLFNLRSFCPYLDLFPERIIGSNMKRKKRKSVSQRRRNSRGKADYNSLEQRLALTTFIVTSLADGVAADGAVTLREAILAANTNAAAGDAAAGDETGDVIRFDSSLAGGSISLTEGQLTISDDVAIQAGNLDITVDADGLSRAFEITSSETVSLGQINVLSGNADIGGAVLASGSGNVIVFGGSYTGNSASGGGAIYSGADSNLFVSGGAVFTDNLAVETGSGGAIYNAGGTAVVDDATFTNNVSNRDGGAIEIAGGELFLTNIVASGNSASGDGGVLHVTAGDVVSITDSTFSENFATAEGGAIWNQAGTTLLVNGSSFTGSIASGGGGGVIFNNGGDLVVNGGDFTQNGAIGQDGSGGAIFSTDGRVLVRGVDIGMNVSSESGGAIEIVDGEFFDTDSVYSENTARLGNGGAVNVTGEAIYAFSQTQFFNNSAGSEGGAVWNAAQSTVFLTDVGFLGNTASGSDADNGGGGIFNNGGDVFANRVEFSKNFATGTAGSGGAIFSVDGRVLVQGDSEFSGNESSRAGGAVEIIDGEFFDTDSLYGENETGISQTANPGNGGAFHITGTATAVFSGTQFLNNSAGSEGGAVWNAAQSTVFLSDVEFTGNLANGNEADNGGGGVFNNGGEVFVSGAEFSRNFATGTAGSGGAIFSVDGRVLVQGNSEFIINGSSRAGGAVEIIDGEFFDTDSLYLENETGISEDADIGNGGAFHITGTATAAFIGTQFLNNSAGGEGGAVWNAAGSTTFLTDVDIIRNVASGDGSDKGGGGIFNNGGGVFVNNSTISSNQASGNFGSGGGALSVDGVLRFDNSIISGNQSILSGGGVEVIEGRAVFRTVTLDSNTTGTTILPPPSPGQATVFPTDVAFGSNTVGAFASTAPERVLFSVGNGGAVHVSGNQAVVTFSDSTISNNFAANQGGGLWNQLGNALILDSNTTVSNNSATVDGGGVYTGGQLEAVDTVFSENAAGNDGGGIYITESGNVEIENSSVASNFAGDALGLGFEVDFGIGIGGGVFNLGNFTAVGSSFTDNLSVNIAPAIFTGPEATTVADADNFFAGNISVGP